MAKWPAYMPAIRARESSGRTSAAPRLRAPAPAAAAAAATLARRASPVLPFLVPGLLATLVAAPLGPPRLDRRALDRDDLEIDLARLQIHRGDARTQRKANLDDLPAA